MKSLTQILLAVAFLFLSQTMTAQTSPTVNMTLRSKMGFGMGCANICGYAANGREYALVGNAQGMAIVDVTNPVAPVNLQQITGLTSQWREIKVYRNYAYITTEAAGSGLQIVNLSTLPMAATVKVYAGGDSILTNIQRVHALHIDTAKGYAYLFGANSVITPIGGSATNTNGVAVVLDIKTDPWNPKFVGRSAGNYIHDGYVRGDTLFAGNIYQGIFSIVDFRDKKNPILLNTQATPTAFNHNTWLSDDSKTLFTTDENAGSYLGAYDVSDPLNIKFLDKIRTVAENNAIVHNVHIINDYAVTSWYTEGVTIVDAHRPQNLVQVAQYDTYGAAGSGFQGCWGVYPYLPSGNLVCSNIGDSLYVVTPQYIRACYLEGTITDASTVVKLGGATSAGAKLSGVLVKINSTDMDKKAQSNIQGNYKTGQVTPGIVSVTYSKAGYQSQTFTGIVLSTGAVMVQDVALMPIVVPVELIDFQGIADNKKAKLTWKTASEVNVSVYEIEKRNDENGKENWLNIGSTKAHNTPSVYTLFDENPSLGTEYYRLKMVDKDGQFTYSKIVAIAFSNSQTPVFMYPNPSKNRVYLSENTFKDAEIVSILDISGKVVLQSTVGKGRGGFDIQDLAVGTYVFKVGETFTFRFTKTL
jgi:choice-of-anchor B domain-containing protein